MAPSHREIVARALAAHHRQLEAFVRARAPRADVEDLLHTASVRAIERAEHLDDPERALAWLYRLVQNVVVDEARSRASRARREQLAAETSEPPLTMVDEPCRCSSTLVRELPPRYQAMLTLVDLGDASVPEAASRLGITTNNASVRLHRARRALRQKMQEHCGVSSAAECQDCRCTYDGCCD